MSSILIKGMSLPSECSECLFSCYDVSVCAPAECIILGERSARYSRLKNCPLVALPTPHGRLIDADILLDTIRYGAEVRDFCNKKCKSQDCRNCIIKSVYKIIREALTVIEAEGADNE